MMWIKSTLWQYLTDEGYEVDSEGILTPGSPIPPEETAVPDPESFPEEEVIGRYTGGDSYVPIKDYLPYLTNPSKGGQVFYPITIDKSALMKFARENDGSPNSILSAAMFRMCSRVFPKAKQISSGIVCNYRKDVGCPETYRDLVRSHPCEIFADNEGLAPYIEEIYSLTEGHLMLEVNSAREKFCIAFQVLNRDENFIREFVKVLEEEGISYELGEMVESRLPHD